VGQRPAFFVAVTGERVRGKDQIRRPSRPADGAAEAGERPVEIEAVIGPSLAAMGYDVVRVLISGGHAPRLQVMVERTDRAGMTVDDCAEVSRAVSALLDVADPIAGPYTLEVSSPGIDRPLTRLEDYSRFAGHEARLEVRLPIAGRRRFRGRLAGVQDRSIRLEPAEATQSEEPVLIPFDEIQRAKLLLTDALIAAAGNGPGDRRR
jgi:ribosome maturation factor RimP